MTEPKSSSAAGPLGGYLFQCELGLIRLVEFSRELPDVEAAIEVLDDVHFESEGTPIEILQSKHQIKRVANLTATSTDFWKTVFNWIRLIKAKGVDLKTVRLILMTTGKCEGLHSLEFLKSGNTRDVDQALSRLDIVAASVEQDTGIHPYTSEYQQLAPTIKRALLEAIYIQDQLPQLPDIEQLYDKSLRHSFDRKYLSSARQAIRGWWYERVCQALAAGPTARIRGEELSRKISEIRASHDDRSLPIDSVIRDKRFELKDPHLKLVLVHQLHLIQQSTALIEFALNDYFKAYAQRSKWAREGVLHMGELQKYETRLVDEWTRLFERMKRDLGEQAAESEKIRLGRQLLDNLDSREDFRVREFCDEKFVSRGTLHGLANKQTVGWHPNFRERLQTLLDLNQKEDVA